VPWRINKYILGVMEMFWDAGGGKAYVPLKFETNFEKNIHSQVFNFQINESQYTKRNEFSKAQQRQNDVISLKSDFILKLQVAKAFKDLNVFHL
jgi:DNA-directed RNA polymerase